MKKKAEKHEFRSHREKSSHKDFQKLYRELVKKTHPDKTKDPEEKAKREEWIKRLSQAWENRNYHEILLIQHEISDPADDSIPLSTKLLKPLINNLKDAVQKLEVEKHVLIKENPETSFYIQNFNARSEKGILKKVKEYQVEIQYQIEQAEEECYQLKTQKSTKQWLDVVGADIEMNNFEDAFYFGMDDNDSDFF